MKGSEPVRVQNNITLPTVNVKYNKRFQKGHVLCHFRAVRHV